MTGLHLHDVVAQWEGPASAGSSVTPTVHWVTRVRILAADEGSLDLEGEREVYFTPPLVRIKAAARGAVERREEVDENLVARLASPLLAFAAHAVAGLGVLMIGLPLLSPPNAKASEVEGLELTRREQGT